MKEIGITEFKVKCSAILDQVRKTRQPVRVTRFGKPFVEIMPPTQKRKLGSMAGTTRIVGDIVGPTGNLDDWEAWRD